MNDFDIVSMLPLLLGALVLLIVLLIILNKMVSRCSWRCVWSFASSLKMHPSWWRRSAASTA